MIPLDKQTYASKLLETASVLISGNVFGDEKIEKMTNGKLISINVGAARHLMSECGFVEAESKN